MSILIKGMTMPRRCADCPMCYDYILCRLEGKDFGELDCIELRADWCPLIEAPPQGKWVLKTFDDGYGEYQLYECNLCGAVTAQRKSKNYCHNCGAKMESEEEK